ncbi:MAG: helix-turn-helix transcriptional regulator [Planctomycetes bacterium]|nr:helix-turn-helix transcriptional regulator [Planctomycetota bacterium]
MLLISCRPIGITYRSWKPVSSAELKLFGQRIRAIRESLGLSQDRLAAKAGLHRTYLGGVERGERNIGILNVFKIARALGVDPRDLFSAKGRSSAK